MMRMWIPLLDLMQTLRVLQTTYLPHPHILSPYPPSTALQQNIESNLEKSLGKTLNIHLQQQMGSFQASMLD